MKEIKNEVNLRKTKRFRRDLKEIIVYLHWNIYNSGNEDIVRIDEKLL
jgi:hypothetical protein